MLPHSVHEAVVYNLLDVKLAKTGRPDQDAREILGLTRTWRGQIALDALRAVLIVANQVTRLNAVKRLGDRYGQQLLDTVVNRGLDGIKADFRPTGNVATDADKAAPH